MVVAVVVVEQPFFVVGKLLDVLVPLQTALSTVNYYQLSKHPCL
jgi:hypothetical protein